jgi:hypothetical protein
MNWAGPWDADFERVDSDLAALLARCAVGRMNALATGLLAMREAPYGRFRRAIRLRATSGAVSVLLEDDVHQFSLVLAHCDGLVTEITGEAHRTPWAVCGGAMSAMSALQGKPIADIALMDPADRADHCLHLHDLVVLAANHHAAGFARDYRVEVDLDEQPSLARLWRDGEEILSWRVEAGTVQGSRFDGVRLSRLGDKLTGLPPDEAEAALVLRRGVLVGLSRTLDLDAIAHAPAAGSDPRTRCYATQPIRHADAARAFGTTRDFWSQGSWPLAATASESPEYLPEQS